MRFTFCDSPPIIMALLALPILILLLLLAVILLLFKRWKLAAITFTALLLHNWYWQVCPLHFFSGEEPTDKTFRVVTYNIYPQVDSTQYDQWQRDMLKEIKRLNPDILCLQEFKGSEMEWLESNLSEFFSYTEKMAYDRRFIKWVLYSRYPLTQVANYKPIFEFDATEIDSTFNRAIRNNYVHQPFYSANVHLPSGDSLTVFCCHLQSNGYSTIRRSMKESESWFNGFGRYYKAIKTAERIRYWEAQNLRHVLDSIGDIHPVIVAGDMNDFNQSRTLCAIQGETLSDAWWRRGCGLGFTFSGFGLLLRLDHILYNNKLQLHNVEVGNSELSDHCPLIADFSIYRQK